MDRAWNAKGNLSNATGLAPSSGSCLQGEPPRIFHAGTDSDGHALCRSEGLAFSFNGGKDSTVLLHILLDAVQLWSAAQGQHWEPESGLLNVHVFFFLGPDEFPEVKDFVSTCGAAHFLDVHIYTCGFKDGLQRIVSEQPVKAIFMGSRRGDPNCRGQVCGASTIVPPLPL